MRFSFPDRMSTPGRRTRRGSSPVFQWPQRMAASSLRDYVLRQLFWKRRCCYLCVHPFCDRTKEFISDLNEEDRSLNDPGDPKGAYGSPLQNIFPLACFRMSSSNTAVVREQDRTPVQVGLILRSGHRAATIFPATCPPPGEPLFEARQR